MALSKEDIEILEDIVSSNGNCLKESRCKKCPFRSQCLPEFLYPNPPSKQERLRMSLDVLTYNSLMEEEVCPNEVYKTQRGSRKNTPVD